jgi:uncharacterized protein YjlB
MQTVKPRIIEFRETEGVPNNPTLPVLIYKGAIEAKIDLAAEIEQMFEQNDWPPQWRDGIYDFHHYHSTAHEVLGIARGEARVMLGGPDGEEMSLFAGDVVVLPAGTGHKRLSASQEFLVVGAYPDGQDWDLIRGDEPEKLEAAKGRIRHVPLPLKDPVMGGKGPLMHLWNRIADR